MILSGIAMLIIALCQCYHVYVTHRDIRMISALMKTLHVKLEAWQLDAKPPKLPVEQPASKSPDRWTDKARKRFSERKKEWWAKKRAQASAKPFQD